MTWKNSSPFKVALYFTSTGDHERLICLFKYKDKQFYGWRHSEDKSLLPEMIRITVDFVHVKVDTEEKSFTIIRICHLTKTISDKKMYMFVELSLHISKSS